MLSVVLTVFAGSASAEIIDDITLHTDASGEVDAVIKFTVPIQYLRHFPQRKSPYVAIFFNILSSVPRDEWKDYESHRSPPSDFITGFTISTRDINAGPKIQIQFDRPVEYDVTPGKSGRSLLIHFKKPDPKPRQSGGVPAVVAAVPLVQPATASAAAIPKPAVTAEAAAKPAAKPAAPAPQVVASAPVVQQPPKQPEVVAAKPSETRTGKTTIVPSRLGPKDGLPPFPVLEIPAEAAAASAPAEAPTLAEQINQTNGKAAVQMARGQDALLAGQPFAAVEPFNNVLNMPPNKYTQDAQVWIGIAREKSGQAPKARLEYETYLKLYPQGSAAPWVKDRLARLNAILPPPAASAFIPPALPVQPSEFHTAEFGSLSMYYYNGSSHTDSISTVNGVQVPTTLTVNDQSALFTNVMMSVRSYNNEYDNRIVFQDTYLKNFLPNGENRNRLGAAYAEVKNRISNYSVRVGRQSAFGGGVLGRFDGVNAGYGITPDWRINVVAGQLADQTVGDQPKFVGGSIDFGVRSAFGGSFYYISQTVSGITDRQAVGGNLRYFEPRKTVFAMVDYDTQFQQLNMFTLQGSLNSESGVDYNFMLDRRRTPSLSIRNAVNGTTASIQTLLDNGWTTDDLIALADSRTATANLAMFGFTNHLSERWQLGTDVTLSNITGLDQSGTLNPDFTTGIEGFVPATPPTGNAWTVSERLIGNDVIATHDLTLFSVSLSRTEQVTGKSFLMNNHAFLREPWVLDSTLRLFWQDDYLGGTAITIAPSAKIGYLMRTSLTLEAEAGLDWTRNTPNEMQTSTTVRQYFALGFRWNF
ncbi:MAG TPA: hypothetical protein VIU93_06980 [Gallionellaceae bacterium]